MKYKIHLLSFFIIFSLKFCFSLDQITKDAFGATTFEKLTNSGTDSEVQFAVQGISLTESRLQSIFNTISEFPSKEKIEEDKSKCGNSKDPYFFKFAAFQIGIFGRQGDPETIQQSMNCFKDVTINFQILDSSSVSFDMIFEKPESLLCTEVLIFATGLNLHMKEVFFRGKHSIKFSNLSPQEIINIKHYGFHLYKLCDSLKNLIPDIIMTGLIFADMETPKYFPKMSKDFIEKTLGYKFVPRKDEGILQIDEHLIHSGDLLQMYSFNGLSQLIQYGTGGFSDHTVMCVWIENELWVLESGYPTIMKTKFQEYLEAHYKEGYLLVLNQLAPKYSAKFNVEKALEYFNKWVGNIYGYHNFLYSFLDTADKNLPPPGDGDLLPLFFELFDSLHLEKYGLPDLYREGINFRLGTKNLSFAELTEEMYKRNISFMDVVKIPENDDWKYHDGIARVCSALATDILRHAGVFDDLEISATEFTPRDVYMLKIYDTQKPEICQNADPDLPYCQLMGNYKMELPWYNTIDLYPHMNERCASEFPKYIRPDFC